MPEFESQFARIFWPLLCHSIWSIPLIGLAFSYGLKSLSPARGDRRLRLTIIASFVGPVLFACLFQSLEANTFVPAESHFESLAVSSIVKTTIEPTEFRPTPGEVPPARTIEPPYLISLERTGHKAILWLIFAWLAGILILTGRLIAASTLFRLTTRIEMCEPNLRMIAEALAECMNLSHTPVVLISKSITQPLVTGLLRPEIILPFQFTTDLEEDQIEAVIAHELAHVRRKDLVQLLIQRLAAILWFFHPAIHRLNRKASLWREMATDRLATDVTGNPLALARALESVAIGIPRSSHFESFAIMFSSPMCRGRLGTRIEALLGPKGFCPMKISGKLRIAYLILAIACAVPLTKLAAIGQEPEEPEKKNAETPAPVTSNPFVNQVQSISETPSKDMIRIGSMDRVRFNMQNEEGKNQTEGSTNKFEFRYIAVTGKTLDGDLNENADSLQAIDGRRAWSGNLDSILKATNSIRHHVIRKSPTAETMDNFPISGQIAIPVTTGKTVPVRQDGKVVAVTGLSQTTDYRILFRMMGTSSAKSARIVIEGHETMPKTIEHVLSPVKIETSNPPTRVIETAVIPHSEAFEAEFEIPKGKSLVLKLGKTIEETHASVYVSLVRLMNRKLWNREIYPFVVTQRYLVVTPL
jgi:hypothetical protein